MAKHSEEAIELVWLELNKELKNVVSSVLEKMAGRLEITKKKEVRRKTTKQLTSDVTFRQYIIRQIQRLLNDFERKELSGEPALNTNFNFKIEWADTVDETAEHESIIQAEDSAKSLTLICPVLSRKILYIYIAKKIKREARKSVKQSLEEGRLKVSYRTFLRYVAFANDVIRFPRLLVVDLTFSQILKYRGQLANYFASAEGLALAAQISMPLTFKVNGSLVKIEGRDTKPVALKMSVNTGPDCDFEDQHDKSEVRGDRLEEWLEDTEGAQCTEKDEVEILRVRTNQFTDVKEYFMHSGCYTD